MMNDLTPELGRRRRAAWGAYKSIEDVVKKTRNTRWAFRKQEENAVTITEGAVERVTLEASRFTQVKDGIRSPLLPQRPEITDTAAFAKESKIRWTGHVMRFNGNRWTRAVSDWVLRNIKRTTGTPPTRWLDFFTKSFKEIYDSLRIPRERRSNGVPLARDKWKSYWRPLDQLEDQQESSRVRRNYVIYEKADAEAETKVEEEDKTEGKDKAEEKEKVEEKEKAGEKKAEKKDQAEEKKKAEEREKAKEKENAVEKEKVEGKDKAKAV
ncbi:hypothetical protein RB195_004501 [Necator americanus]|uniref:Uncharacterized protein n=1 Tax=Necator americanus TaxID=51031 RepID=A0ABR1BIB1_NECAM